MKLKLFNQFNSFVAVCVLAIIGVISLAFTGCSQKAKEPFRDAPSAGHDNKPARIIEFPDGFSNVSAKCDGPNMVYSAFHGNGERAAMTVVKDDPRCSK